ncbi:MAG: hypothetical protein ACRD1L_10245, partial [Terriglobales bacterium]
MRIGILSGISLIWLGLCAALPGQGGAPPTPPTAPPAQTISLDEAIQLALQHSPALAASRTQIPQSQAQEVTAGLRPNPVLSWDALF